ncbi:MAG: hypothetical protein KC657_23465 [Myxococcales bacterium]|nr:hypothetical protein [Myxococcales bacterium]
MSRATLCPTLALLLLVGVGCQAGAPPPERAVVHVASEAVSAAPVANASAATQDPAAPPAPIAPPAPVATATDDEQAEAAPAPSPSSAPRGATCGLQAKVKAVSTPGGDQTFALTLTNAGKAPVSLVVPGDGSEVGWRTPVISWSVTTPKGAPVAERGGGRCGMMNRIEASEIFTLAPGASRTIGMWVAPPNVAPGTYNVQLRYRNDPSIGARKGNADPAVVAKIAASSACDVTTPTIRVTLR